MRARRRPQPHSATPAPRCPVLDIVEAEAVLRVVQHLNEVGEPCIIDDPLSSLRRVEVGNVDNTREPWVLASLVPHLRLQLLEEVLAYCQFANDAGTNDRLSMMTPTAIAHARSMILAGVLMFMASGENPV